MPDRFLSTPMGQMLACTSPRGLCSLRFLNAPAPHVHTDQCPTLDLLERELQDYFHDNLATFSVPLDLEGTEFQREVWRELLRIPRGATRSYSDIAKAIARPDAVRAVAKANADNRIAILVPCHRVIGSDGSLTGYAAGLDRKRALLQLEAAQAVATQPGLFSLVLGC